MKCLNLYRSDFKTVNGDSLFDYVLSELGIDDENEILQIELKCIVNDVLAFNKKGVRVNVARVTKY